MATGRPVLIRDGDSTPFWEGVDRHQLRIQQCLSCSQPVFYPRSICPHCFSDQLEWITTNGRGHIYSYTIVHRSYGPFAQETPYVVAIVELDRGVRMLTRITGSREGVTVGAPVRVTFEQVDEELTLPYFVVDAPVDSGEGSR